MSPLSNAPLLFNKDVVLVLDPSSRLKGMVVAFCYTLFQRDLNIRHGVAAQDVPELQGY